MMNMDGWIGTLHFQDCCMCIHCGDNGCTADDQEVQDNLTIDGVVNVKCGCFERREVKA
jgi:hypothetical protein